MAERLNSDLAVDQKTNWLQGISISVCCGGGIAAIEAPRVVRELRRHGAVVRVTATENCLRFIGRESLEWASSNPVTVQPTGMAEHIDTSDCVLVFPATADILGKVAAGLCVDGVTTQVQSALGQNKPVFFIPTMHSSLSSSPFVEGNRAELAKLENVCFLEPRKEEGKEKAPSPENIAIELSHSLKKMQRGHILRAAVTFGGTRVMLDPVRCLTNLSTGRLGSELVKSLYAKGVEVRKLQASVSLETEQLNLKNTTTVLSETYQEMRKSLSGLNRENTDAVFHLAAVSDYFLEEPSQQKLKSGQKELTLQLTPTEKLLKLSNLQQIPFQAACKLTDNESEGLAVARKFLCENQLSAVLWNSSQALGNTESHHAILIESAPDEKSEKALEGKRAIAEALADSFLTHFHRAPKSDVIRKKGSVGDHA